MKNLIELLKNITNEKLELSTRAGIPTIKSTQRNKMKQEIEQATLTDLQNIFAESDLIHVVDKTAEGIIIAIEHEQLVNNKNTESEICLELNIKIKNLDYDIEQEIENHKIDLQEKAEKEKEKELAKKRKQARDKKNREDKAKLRKEKIERNGK